MEDITRGRLHVAWQDSTQHHILQYKLKLVVWQHIVKLSLLLLFFSSSFSWFTIPLFHYSSCFTFLFFSFIPWPGVQAVVDVWQLFEAEFLQLWDEQGLQGDAYPTPLFGPSVPQGQQARQV